ncbi:acyltransferase [Bacillota bacterium Lsc_1132]
MKYLKAIIRRLLAFLKLSSVKIIHINSFSFKINEMVSLSTRFAFLNGGHIKIGKSLATERNVDFHVAEGGVLTIGDNCYMNKNCVISCHKEIVIGNKCALGPNVMIYDNDHDFRAEGGKIAGKYKVSSVVIGNNVWIGANTVILRGTHIGDNCVIGAGSVISGHYPDNTIIVQKRETSTIKYEI